MAELVASRSMQTLEDLAVKKKTAKEKFENEVNNLLSVLRQIEEMLDDGHKINVLKNVEGIMRFIYMIENFLEIWAVNVEGATLGKRGFIRILGRFFGRHDDGTAFIGLGIFIKKYVFGWHDNTSPDDFPQLWSLADERTGGIMFFMYMIECLLQDWAVKVESAYTRKVGIKSILQRINFMKDRVCWRDNISSENSPEVRCPAAEESRQIKDLKILTDLVKSKRVVWVCGVEGIGKTSLARKIYRHLKVRTHFNAFAWVSFTEHRDISSLLRNILNQLVAEEKKKNSGDSQGLNITKPGATENKTEQEKGAGGEEKDADQVGKKGKSEKKKDGKAMKKKSVDQVNTKEEEDMEKGGEAVKKSAYVEKRKGMLSWWRRESQKEKGAEAVKERADSKEEEEEAEEKEKDAGAEQKNVDQDKKKRLDEKDNGPVKKSEADQENLREEEKEKVAKAVKKRADSKEEEEAEEKEKLLNEKDKGTEAVKKSDVDQENPREEEEEEKVAKAMKKRADSKEEEEEEAEENEKQLDEKDKGAEEVNKSVVDQENKKEEEEKEKKSAYIEKRKGMRMWRRKKPEKGKGVGAVRKRENTKEEEEKEEEEIGVEALQKNAHEEKKKSTEAVRNEIEEEKEQRADAVKKIVVDQDNKDEAPKSDDQKQQLIKELKEIQGKKKCFIVINDISETSRWEEISSAFDWEETRILLTTPDTTTIPDAVSHEDTKADKVFYELKPLDEKEGWKLLKKVVFHGKRAPEKGIVSTLAKQMLVECNGLPLTISTLGKILSAEPPSEWHKVNNDVVKYLEKDEYKIQSKEKSDDQPTGLKKIKNYDELTYYKKQCFLFLAVFKGNEDVDSEDLKLLWMAEGMVPPHCQPTMDEAKHQQSTIDIAKEYVEEIADKFTANGKFKPLHLLNEARELSLQYGVREDFRLKVLDFSGGQQPTFPPYFFVRRLAIHFNKLSSSLEEDALYGTPLFRSLFFLNSDREYTVLPVKISDFKKFILLRVLHFVRCKFDGRKLPQGIDALCNLRYLGVIYCDLAKLPASISNVKNLHILNVRAYDDAKITIPNDIYQMARLKHLRLPDNLGGEQSTLPRHRDNSVHEQLNKIELDGLHNLESLDGFNADIHDVKSLSKLEKLRHLVAYASSNDSLESIIKFVKVHGVRVRTNLYVESKCNFTSEEGLEIFEEVLMCPNLHSITLSMVRVDEFPNCERLASKDLTEIKLIGCKLSKDPMKALGNFPNLQKLCFGYGAFVGKEMTIDNEGFPKLKYLELSHLSNLEEWRAAEGAMKSLLAMTINRCPNLNQSTFDSSRKNLKMVSDSEQTNNNENETCSFKRSNDDDELNLSTFDSSPKKSHIRSNGFTPWETDYESHYPSSYNRNDDALLFPESITTSSLTQAQRKFDPSSSGTSAAH